MISIFVSIKEAGGQRGKEGERESGGQPVEITHKLEYQIWKPTQEGEFLAAPTFRGDRNKEGVFIVPAPYEYQQVGGIKAVEIVSRGKAKVFLRTDRDEEGKYRGELCLIPFDSLIQATPGVAVIPNAASEKHALIIFQELGETADIFLRVNGEFTAEAKIECQKK